MAPWTALVAAAALAQAEPGAGDVANKAAASAPEAGAEDASGKAAPTAAEAAARAPDQPPRVALEAGAFAPAHAAPGELKVAVTLGGEFARWRAGPLRLGFRGGLIGGGAGGAVCNEKGLSCGASGLYAGVTGAIVYERRPLAAWAGVSTSAFYMADEDVETRFAGLELARFGGGVDVPAPWSDGEAWIGLFASRSYTTVGAHPAPLADSAGWMWGGGVRLTAAH
jgi:hypothetical protein